MMHVSVAPSTVTLTVVPANPCVVGKGNDGAFCSVDGPSPAPYTAKIAPCATPELGKPGGSVPAALVTPLIEAPDNAAAQLKITATTATTATMRCTRIDSPGVPWLSTPTFPVVSSGAERVGASPPVRWVLEGVTIRQTR